MVGRRILFFVSLIVLLAALSFGGIYLYKIFFTKQTSVVPSSGAKNFVMTGLKNGGSQDFPQSVGGIDDSNSGGAFPIDIYYKAWPACNSENKYCGTNDKNAEKQDPNTGLVWSGQISSASTWFFANNCKYPNGLPGDDGVCDTSGEVACRCVKNPGGSDTKVGCENVSDGAWRLPYQKELMQAYIDGSYTNLTNTNLVGYWTATTRSDTTQNAWAVYLDSGNTGRNDKLATYPVRCVR